jgi:hypothetical protein
MDIAFERRVSTWDTERITRKRRSEVERERREDERGMSI